MRGQRATHRRDDMGDPGIAERETEQVAADQTGGAKNEKSTHRRRLRDPVAIGIPSNTTRHGPCRVRKAAAHAEFANETRVAVSALR